MTIIEFLSTSFQGASVTCYQSKYVLWRVEKIKKVGSKQAVYSLVPVYGVVNRPFAPGKSTVVSHFKRGQARSLLKDNGTIYFGWEKVAKLKQVDPVAFDYKTKVVEAVTEHSLVLAMISEDVPQRPIIGKVYSKHDSPDLYFDFAEDVAPMAVPLDQVFSIDMSNVYIKSLKY